MPRFDLAARARLFTSAALAIAIGTGIVGTGVFAAGFAAAGEIVISQKKRKFTPSVVRSKVGDKVIFLNDDRFAHNLFSETPGHEFDVRKQMPGDRHVLTLSRKGEFQVRCAIHPRMRMKITVE
jgi:plastocyanin